MGQLNIVVLVIIGKKVNCTGGGFGNSRHINNYEKVNFKICKTEHGGRGKNEKKSKMVHRNRRIKDKVKWTYGERDWKRH